MSLTLGAGVLLALTGCRSGGTDTTSATTSQGTTSTGTATSTSTGTTTAGTSSTTATTPTETSGRDFTGVVLVNSDTERYADLGYVLDTYEVTADYEVPYVGVEGNNPVFYVFRPADATPDEALTTVIWFHGAATGYDADGGTVPGTCTVSQVENNIENVLGNTSLVTYFFADRRWTLLLPRNDFCDAWLGKGPDDPVDPEHHFGYYHARLAMDFVLDGHAGFSSNGRAYAWGTSAGATAAAVFAAWYPRDEPTRNFDGLIIDSGACNWDIYWETITGDRDAIEEILGGPPDSPEQWVQDRYDQASCDWLVANGWLDLPVYATYNYEDLIIPYDHFEALAPAMDGRYPAQGINYGYKDLNHLAPGGSNPVYHVQTRIAVVPFGYTTVAMMDFLEGNRLIWTEAEDATCAACTVGTVDGWTGDGDPDADWKNFSQMAGRQVERGASGTFYSEPIPQGEGLVAGKPMIIVPQLKLDDVKADATDADPVVTLVYREGGQAVQEVSFTVGDFAPAGSASNEDFVNQYLVTRMTVTPTDVASGEVRLVTQGVGRLRLDGVLFHQEFAP